MNENYYTLDEFTPAELKIVQDFFWKRMYPIHAAYKFVKANVTPGMIVTYFRIPDDLLDDEIANILIKYPMLGRDCLITESAPGGATPVHCDGKIDEPDRQCAVNFPIIGCTPQSYISFYGPLSKYPAVYKEKLNTTFIAGDIKLAEVDRMELVDKPVLINTQAWHSVENRGSERRIMFSWSVIGGMSYDAALLEFRDCI